FSPNASTTESFALSLHDALPIWIPRFVRLADDAPVVSLFIASVVQHVHGPATAPYRLGGPGVLSHPRPSSAPAAVRCGLHVFYRSEEHTSELQSRLDLVCRLLFV